MPSIYASPDEAYAAIDDGLRQRVQEDDELAMMLTQLPDEDLQEVKTQWRTKQAKDVQIDTGRKQTVDAAPGFVKTVATAGASMLGGRQMVARTKEVPVTRPLADPQTEQDIASLLSGDLGLEDLTAADARRLRPFLAKQEPQLANLMKTDPAYLQAYAKAASEMERFIREDLDAETFRQLAENPVQRLLVADEESFKERDEGLLPGAARGFLNSLLQPGFAMQQWRERAARVPFGNPAQLTPAEIRERAERAVAADFMPQVLGLKTLPGDNQKTTESVGQVAGELASFFAGPNKLAFEGGMKAGTGAAARLGAEGWKARVLAYGGGGAAFGAKRTLEAPAPGDQEESAGDFAMRLAGTAATDAAIGAASGEVLRAALGGLGYAWARTLGADTPLMRTVQQGGAQQFTDRFVGIARRVAEGKASATERTTFENFANWARQQKVDMAKLEQGELGMEYRRLVPREWTESFPILRKALPDSVERVRPRATTPPREPIAGPSSRQSGPVPPRPEPRPAQPAGDPLSLPGQVAPAAVRPAPVASPLPPAPSQKPGAELPDGPNFRTEAIPLENLQLSKDVPQFKEGADPRTGVIEPLGDFRPEIAGPIAVWERVDGTLEVISGRHRLDSARRTPNINTIEGRIFREADGFTQQDALTFDAELNILDGQGTIKDYADYFRNSPTLTAEQAAARGLLQRAKGNTGWALGRLAEDDIYTAYRNGQLGEAKAAAIAQGAPNHVAAQRLAMADARGRSAPELKLLAQRYSEFEGLDATGAEQTSLFDDDEAFQRMVREAQAEAKAQSQMIAEAQDQIRAVKGAAKNPEAARKLGVDVKDPESVISKIDELAARVEALNNPGPELRNEIRIAAGLKPREIAPTEAAAPIEDPNQGGLFDQPAAEAPDLSLEALTPAQAAAEQAKLDAQAAARQQREAIEEGQQRRLEGGMGDANQGRLLDLPEDNGELFATSGTARRIDSPERPAPTPDWVLRKPESRTGGKLVKQIAADRDGKKVGPGHIAEFINKLTKVQVRRSTSQTTQRNPAHYRKNAHMVMTANPVNGDYAFHEAGHGLKELIESRVPGFFKGFEGDLLAIQSLPGSKSSARANSPEAYKLHEGVAEWLRLRIKDPVKVQDFAVTEAIEQRLAEQFPQMAQGIRDAARAWHAHSSRSAAARLMAEQQVPTSMNLFAQTKVLGNIAAKTISEGSVIRDYDRSIYRAIVKNRRDIGKSYNQAHQLAREARKRTRKLEIAYNYVLSIGSETQFAMQGDGPLKGIRVYNAADNLQIVNPKTAQDLITPLGAKWPEFQLAGWARTMLERYRKGIDYTGQRNGVTPQDLQTIVDDAARTIPNFDKHYKAIEQWFGDLLKVKEMGGLKSSDEVAKMQSRWLDYWPLPKQFQERGVSGGPNRMADIVAGDYRATGSELPLRDLVEVMEDRAHSAFRGFYYNQLGLRLADEFAAISKTKALPLEARAIAGRALTPLKPQKKLAATIHEDEVKKWVLDGLKDHIEKISGEPLPPDAMPRPEQITLFDSFMDIWRTTRPNDYNVVGLLRNGEREFYLVENPELFRVFAGHEDVSTLVRGMNWLIGQETRNWKRNITQSLPFALNNVRRDLINQMPLGRGPASFVPGLQTVIGLENKLSNRYPQVREMGLLLSRSQPTDVEMVDRIKHSAVWNFMAEGFWTSSNRDPRVRLVSTILQPGNLLNPLHKAVDVMNFLTGGRTLARIGEEATREGGAVQAKLLGLSDGEAKLRYWETTGQFNETPGAKDLAMVFRSQGFTNPMLQANRQHLERATDPDPIVRGAYLWKVLVQIPAMAATAAWLIYKNMSDEEKEIERERTIVDRMAYYDIKGIRMPFAYGPEGATMSMAYNSIMDHLLDRETKWKDKAPLLGQRVIDFGGLFNLSGSMGKTLIETQTNWDGFRKQHIVSPWLEGLPASEQYGYNTPEFYKNLGRWINYSPDKLRHIVSNGIARQVDEVFTVLDNIERGRPMRENADLPFVGRLFTREPNGFNSASVQDLQALSDKVTLINRRMDAMGLERAKDGRALINGTITNPEQVALAVQYGQLTGLQNSIRMIDRWQKLARQYEDAKMWAAAHNARRMMVDTAQNGLAHGEQWQQQAEQVLTTLEQMLSTPER